MFSLKKTLGLYSRTSYHSKATLLWTVTKVSRLLTCSFFNKPQLGNEVGFSFLYVMRSGCCSSSQKKNTKIIRINKIISFISHIYLNCFCSATRPNLTVPTPPTVVFNIREANEYCVTVSTKWEDIARLKQKVLECTFF